MSEDLKEALLDLLTDLSNYAVAAVYPDGPCIEQDDMERINDIIERLEEE